MIKILLSASLAVLGLAAPSLATAQTATSRIIDVTFTGVVASPVENSVRIRQPDGTYAAYTGPVPEFPYKAGDAVSVSFKANLPTRAFYDTVYQGQVAADGIYKFRVTTSSSGAGLVNPGLGGLTPADFSGPLAYSPNYGELPFTSMTITYDYNSDSYSLENGGAFAAGNLWGPGYKYDGTTGQLIGCTTTGCAPPYYDYNSSFMRGDTTGTMMTASNIGIYNTATDENRYGLFDLSFIGSWNLPKFGGSTQVPEPGMLLLFGAAAAALPLRRRRMKQAA